MDPGPFTLRELVWMSDGKRRDEWDRTSLLASLVFNQWRKKSELRQPSRFHPFEAKRKHRNRLTPANITDLKYFLPDHSPDKHT